MAKKVTGYIKLQIPAGKATPAPPVGPALGQHGVNIVQFTKEFNARTADKGDLIIPVVITVYADRSFSFITKTPPAAVLLKKACNIKSGSGVPNKTKVATISKDKVKEIVTEGEWDDPAVLQMAQDIEELASNGYYSEMVGSNVWPAGQNTELALGTAAMYLNGSWLPNEVKEMAGPDFHWGCFAYPALTDGANGIETNNFGAQVFGINKDTKLAKEAFDLITFLTIGEYDQKLADETVGIPADTTNTEWPAMVECAKPVIEQSTNRFTWACGVESNVDMTPVIKENFIKLMAGSITADEFVSTMQDAAK